MPQGRCINDLRWGEFIEALKEFKVEVRENKIANEPGGKPGSVLLRLVAGHTAIYALPSNWSPDDYITPGVFYSILRRFMIDHRKHFRDFYPAL